MTCCGTANATVVNAAAATIAAIANVVHCSKNVEEKKYLSSATEHSLEIYENTWIYSMLDKFFNIGYALVKLDGRSVGQVVVDRYIHSSEPINHN
jgi:hypothetical protein